MTPFEFGQHFGHMEKQALNPILNGLWQGGKHIVKGLGGIDNAAGGLMRSLGSGSHGIGKIFGAVGDMAKPIGQGIVRGGESLANNNIKNEAIRDLIRMVGYGTKTFGKGVTSTGGGAGLVGTGFKKLDDAFKYVGNLGYGAPTLATLGLGGAGFQAGVLQNPIRIAPSADHIDVRSPVTLPPSVRNMIGEPPPRRPRPRYTASGKRIR